MPDGLYDADILIWAETQADLLRRLAAGERVDASGAPRMLPEACPFTLNGLLGDDVTPLWAVAGAERGDEAGGRALGTGHPRGFVMPLPYRSCVVLAMGLLVGGPAGWGQERRENFPPGPALEGNANSMLKQADREFLVKDAQGAAYERELAMLAARKSQDPRVKQFAAMVVSDHNAYNAALANVGQTNGLPLPSAPGAEDAAKLKRFAGMEGKAFDDAFLREMQDVNAQDLKDAQAEKDATWNVLIHDFIERYGPIDEKHLQAAKALAG